MTFRVEIQDTYRELADFRLSQQQRAKPSYSLVPRVPDQSDLDFRLAYMRPSHDTAFDTQ